MEEKKMIGYKGFDKDFKCRGFQYEVGKTYKHEGKLSLCESGFHFCENPFDVWGYYPPTESHFAEVEADGETKKETGGDTKTVCSSLHIKAELSLKGVIDAGLKFIMDKVDWKNAKVSNTGDYSVASNTGDYSAASNTGDYSAASNTGNRSAASNTGNRSAASNTGYYSVASNTGDYSAASNTGGYSAASNTGYYSAASNTGYHSVASNTGGYSAASNTGGYSAASNTGDYSAASNTGNRSAASNTGNRSAASNTGNRSAASNTGGYSAASNTGYYSVAEVSGQDSIACGLGIKNKARGSKGCWIVLADRKDDGTLKEVKAVKVDGRKIKADVWYELKKGKFVAAK